MNSTSRCASDSSGCSSQHVNVGDSERLASVVGGGLVLISLARYGSLPGILGTLVGAGLLYRGLTGHCSMYEALEIDTSEDGDEDERYDLERSQRCNAVEIASDDSFPASDAPAWTGVAT